MIQETESRLDVLFKRVRKELVTAMAAYPAMHSAHEGYAVLLEEVDELWEVVKKKPALRDKYSMYCEAKQIAAMAIRFMHDICGEWEI